MTISSLQSATSSDWAQRNLSHLSSWWSGRLRGIAAIYLPYRLYHVVVHDHGSAKARYFAVDAVAGTLDPYEFPAAPEPGCWTEVETRNCHPVTLEESETKELAIEKVRRLLFSRGFFRVAHPQITAELIHPAFYIPYWVGFYGDERNVSIKVLNAIRQTLEGNKVRHVVKAWLMEDLLSARAPTAVLGRNRQ